VSERSPLDPDRLPLALVRFDADNVIVDWNQEATRLFGYTRDEAIGREGVELLCPEPASGGLATVLQRIQSGDMEAHSINQNRTRDGRTIVCRWHNTPQPDGQGRYECVSLAQEVTDVVRAEQALQQSHAVLRAVIEGLPDRIYVKDREGRYLLANSSTARTLGRAVDDVIGRTDAEWFPPDAARRVREMDERAMATDGSISYEQVLPVADGERCFQTTKVAYRSPAGDVIGVLCVSQDVTERREAEQRLQALSRQLLTIQERERQRIARELHDQLGHALATINLAVHAARRLAGPDAQPELDRCTTLVHQAGDQVRALARELRPPLLEEQGLEATLRALAARHAHATGHDVAVLGQLAGTPLDPDVEITCYRVVQEALTNVIRHSSAHRVEIRLDQTELGLEVAVQDDGAGFDPRGDAGGGVGLTGMAERVRLVGGTLTVTAKPGMGTCIRAHLPVKP
jgi:two-component system sensor histidine kinase UhpB